MSQSLNILVCHRCDQRQRNCLACKCLADPASRPFIEVAEAGECPLDRHGAGAAPYLASIGATIGDMVHGAAGIAKALTGTGGADPAMIESRTAICSSCDQSKSVAGVFMLCKLCGCATWAKVRNANEKCPLGKW